MLYDLTLQPFAAIIGPLDNPDGFYICVDDTKYKIDSCIRMLELLFKLFHALDVEYPAECQHVWIFLEEMVFDIKGMKKNCTSSALIADVKFHVTD